ncbi:MAG TPA: GNAT family N-acetyltransferase [Chryseosolibacter sp.]|nr:GNAT family N-acetyltransferase [Chryseosolibacter sp.]
MFYIRDASIADIGIIQEITEKTWWPTYSPIISDEQIRYMIDYIYSTDGLQNVMTTGEQKFLLLYDNDVVGFASYGIRPNQPSVFKLHKLYVLPQTQGKGYGKALVEEVIARVRLLGGTTLELNVNRYNNAKKFYELLGFRVAYEEDVAIGPYWMNDYVMRLEL